MTLPVRAVIQARMSSTRFPGKVLAPLGDRPLVTHVVDAVCQVLDRSAVVVATSTHPSDDPLAVYLEHVGVAVFRGPLDDVFARFRGCVQAYPCDWVLRVSADSPLLDPVVVRRVVEARRPDCDLITTIFPRTFPRGQNAELIRTDTLLKTNDAYLEAQDREHVTAYYYRHADQYSIRNVVSDHAAADEPGAAVDTVDDLHRVEQIWMARR